MPAPTPQPWAVSHAALPVADDVSEHGFWLYYSARDANNRAHVARVRVAIEHGALVAHGHQAEPVLAPGSLGAFDESGVTVSCVVDDGEGRKLLYYTGWTLGVTVPFYFYVGVAVSEDGGRSFQRVSRAPVLERSAVDPYLTASPYVLRDGERWRMWYVSCREWARREDGEPFHYYHVRYAESGDGIRWRREGRVAIDFASPDEYAIARPCVRRAGDGFLMWYSFRGAAYRLGCAESADGLTWRRRDELAHLETSDGGWDSEMIAYPYVFSCGGQSYLLYNGNGYGRTGIGWASLEEGT